MPDAARFDCSGGRDGAGRDEKMLKRVGEPLSAKGGLPRRRQITDANRVVAVDTRFYDIAKGGSAPIADEAVPRLRSKSIIGRDTRSRC
jgi:hypothetical protein